MLAFCVIPLCLLFIVLWAKSPTPPWFDQDFEYLGDPPSPSPSPDPLPDLEEFLDVEFQRHPPVQTGFVIDLTSDDDEPIAAEPTVPIASTSATPHEALLRPLSPMEPNLDHQPHNVSPIDSSSKISKHAPSVAHSRFPSQPPWNRDHRPQLFGLIPGHRQPQCPSQPLVPQSNQRPSMASPLASTSAKKPSVREARASDGNSGGPISAKKRPDRACTSKAEAHPSQGNPGGSTCAKKRPDDRAPPAQGEAVGSTSSKKRPRPAVYSNPFADPTQVGSERRKGKRPVYAEASEDDDSEDRNRRVTIWVSRRFYWYIKKPLTAAQAARPASKQPVAKSSWQPLSSSFDDMGPNRSFDLDLEEATQAGFERSALDLLERQLPTGIDYMTRHQPPFSYTLYGTIMVMTRASARLPARRRIKAQYKISDNASWTRFIEQLEGLDESKEWAGAFWDMSNPDDANLIPQVAHEEASHLAQWHAQNHAPGPAPAPVVPDVTDDRAYSKLAIAITRRYTQNGHGTGDNMIVPHPTKPNWQLNLTPKRLHLWVSRQIAATLDGRNDINIDTPPRGPDFPWSLHGIEQSDTASEPRRDPVASTSQNMMVSASEIPVPAALQTADPRRPGTLDRRMYLSKYCGTMEDFLTYALVGPGDQRTRDALMNAGFNVWASLREGPGMSAQVLIDFGVLPGIAASLIVFAFEFLAHVTACIAVGGFFLPEE